MKERNDLMEMTFLERPKKDYVLGEKRNWSRMDQYHDSGANKVGVEVVLPMLLLIFLTTTSLQETGVSIDDPLELGRSWRNTDR